MVRANDNTPEIDRNVLPRVLVYLDFLEIRLLADAIEQDARQHDAHLGSCPADLHAALERVAELRAMA